MTASQEFIYILRPVRADMLRTGPTSLEAEIVARHFAYLKNQCARGVVLLAGRTTTNDEHTFGVCIFRAGSLADAESFMRIDPAVAEGVMSASLSPFRVALLTPTPVS